MTRRYYVPDLPRSGGLIALSEAEAAHALRVMRVKQGDRICLFDGQGWEAEAVVTAAVQRDCCCEADPPRWVDRELPRAVHVAVSLPKPDRAREMVQRLTELGVTSLTPLVAQRSQCPPGGNQLAKLGRAVIEASKQCGRNRLMDIREPVSTNDFFIRSLPPLRWIADPTPDSGHWQAPISEAAVVVAVGPEGGFTESERQLAMTRGFQPLWLGPRILRVETAATAIAALLSLPGPSC